MLSELRVSQLGVIEDLALVFGPGLTALTGETGAGKTLVVEAIELLLGGRAEAMRVRPGASEAAVEGRFVLPAGAVVPGNGGEDLGRGQALSPVEEQEVVLGRVVPADGRSRGYVDGRMATVSALAQLGQRLVDLHGQHEHQSLFSAAAQRDALDAYAGADRSPREAARRRLRQLDDAMAGSGGDPASRAREMELLRYQLSELEAAALTAPGEDDDLALEEERLARAASHRAAAQQAYESLSGDDQLRDHLGEVVAQLAGHSPLAQLHERLLDVSTELADIAGDAHRAAEELEEDPERLAEVVARRAQLHELRRKYAGPGGGLDEVLAFEQEAGKRLEELEDLDVLASRVDDERAGARAELGRAAGELGRVRRGAAPSFGQAVEAELRRLAMPRARFVVNVANGNVAGGQAGEEPGEEAGEEPGEEAGGDLRQLAGEDVTFLLAANPGEPLLPLSKVASGGELARAMLALRLVLLRAAGGDDARPVAQNGPPTLVFDEVDAGIGGEASVAVGRALANLGRRYQVLVVTHLAQVAAFADAQIAVSKVERAGRSVTLARDVAGKERVVELSRMLSGQPDSRTGRLHAAELLEAARRGN
jgi:DNA repair protein RecN (Recombination protein N)